jgi:hypothetical protein
MNIVASLVANAETAELMEPGNRPFNHPAGLTQSTAMFGVPTSQVGSDATAPEFVAVRLRIVSAIALDTPGSMPRPPRFTADPRNCFHQRQQLRDVMGVGAGQRGCQWNARRIRNDMVLAPRFAAIRWVGTSFCPPSTARTLELSTIARDQSIWSAALSSVSKTSCSRFQTPASCQSRNRRQHVMPHPQPNSCGSIVQGMPLRSTNKMPVSTSRLPTGGRPPRDDATIGGNNGSTNFHNSSDTNNLAMTVLLDWSSPIKTTSR